MVWGLCIALVAGIVQDPRLLVPSLLIFTTISVITIRSRVATGLFVLCSLLFYGYGWLDSTAYRRQTAAFLSACTQQSPLRLEGWIASCPVISGGKSIFSMRTICHGRRIDVGVAAAGFTYRYGDSIAVTGTVPTSGVVTDTTSVRRFAFMRSLHRAGFIRAKSADIRVRGGAGGNRLQRSLFCPAHLAVRNQVVSSMGARGGLPLALLLGEKQLIGKETRTAIKSLGISHLFALSGLHLGMIAGIVLLLFFPFRVSTTIPLAVSLGFYVGIVGNIVSLHRAYAMLLIGCLARMLQRPLEPFAILGRAALILLLLSPGVLYSVAFQFSLLATCAVLFAIRGIPTGRQSSRLKRAYHYLEASLRMSACAQLFILPLALRYFGESSLITPVTTILFLPLVFALLLLSLLCCCTGVISPDCGLAGSALLAKGAHLFDLLLQAAAAAGPPPLRTDPPAFVIYYGGLALLFGSPRLGKWRYGGAVVMLLSFFVPGG